MQQTLRRLYKTRGIINNIRYKSTITNYTVPYTCFNKEIGLAMNQINLNSHCFRLYHSTNNNTIINKLDITITNVDRKTLSLLIRNNTYNEIRYLCIDLSSISSNLESCNYITRIGRNICIIDCNTQMNTGTELIYAINYCKILSGKYQILYDYAEIDKNGKITWKSESTWIYL